MIAPKFAPTLLTFSFLTSSAVSSTKRMMNCAIIYRIPVSSAKMTYPVHLFICLVINAPCKRASRHHPNSDTFVDIRLCRESTECEEFTDA